MTKSRIISFFLTLIVVYNLFINASLHMQGYEVGETVKDFKLKNTNDQYVSLYQVKDAKGVILIFTCNTCPFAVAYEDRIQALHAKYAALGYPVIAINPNDVGKQPGDSFEAMQARAKDKGFTFAYLHDESQETAKEFGATKTPHVYVLQKLKKDFVVQYIGAIDDNTYSPSEVKDKFVEQAIEDLLKGKKVSQNTTKAIGCSIKWKNS